MLYGNEARDVKKRSERGWKTAVFNVGRFFDDPDMSALAITPAWCEARYRRLCTAISQRTSKPLAIDTQLVTLMDAKIFGKWMVAQGWYKESPVSGVKGIGKKRKNSKPQLRVNEAQVWLMKARELADAGNLGAVSAMTALYLGLRKGEIQERLEVRDVDMDGRLLWVDGTKSNAARRPLKVPEELRPYLVRLAAGRFGKEKLFPQRRHNWTNRWVKRICDLAGVRIVCAHSMRGLNSTLQKVHGILNAQIMEHLGHEEWETTEGHYIDPRVAWEADQAQGLKVLRGGIGK